MLTCTFVAFRSFDRGGTVAAAPATKQKMIAEWITTALPDEDPERWDGLG